MGIDIGFNSNTPSLPEGGGSVTGFGETFTPDLSAGTGSYTVRIDSPNGPNDINPGIILRYDSGTGNGPFGLGFCLPLPRIMLSTARAIPQYNEKDSLILEGVGELLQIQNGTLRPEVDANAWQARKFGEGFQVTDRNGLRYFLGITSETRLTNPDTNQIFAWHLNKIEDGLGNTVLFQWLHDGNQLYIEKMVYGPYEMHFNWETRPDVIRSGRAGFLIVTALRCTAIELHLTNSSQPILRRWTLSYKQDRSNGVSLLQSIKLSGFDEMKRVLDTPSIVFEYTEFTSNQLIRFKSIDPGNQPGPLNRTGRRIELIDWGGDGLPDLLEVSNGGNARLWPNLGKFLWGRPQILSNLPMFSSDKSVMAFADMNGNGVADLIRTDRISEGYIPRIPGKGFGKHIKWQKVPAASRFMTPNNRLVDLDGDGRIDLMVSTTTGLELYYRTDKASWESKPQLVGKNIAPPVSLADPHIFLADMSGNGGTDLVRVDGAGAKWWPYLGRGRWGNEIIMKNPPDLPFDVNPERLFLSDIDGDGCADLIYLDQGKVTFWINQSGNGFSEAHVINYVPTGSIQDVRLADMNGGGTAGLLWSTSGPFNRGTVYYYLNLGGDMKPHLLNRIDNGIGLVTKILYTTSAKIAAEAERTGNPWRTFLPLVVPVISEISTTDKITGLTSLTRYNYFDGRYDGVLREFAGFGRVEQEQIGDASIPTLVTKTWFHIGNDPESLEEPSEKIRHRLRAIRGRIIKREHFSSEESNSRLPLDRFEQDWIVDEEHFGDQVVYIPRLVATREFEFDGDNISSQITTTNRQWDRYNNVVETVQTSSNKVENHILLTVNTYAKDLKERFNSRVCRTQQYDSTGILVADTIIEYDHSKEGFIGDQGLITRRIALVLTDNIVIDVYGSSPPDFTKLGYFRRPGSNGWWTNLSSYERTIDADELLGSVTGPLGATTKFVFDSTGMFPTNITTPTGNILQATYDLRTATLSQLIDAASGIYNVNYDPLARVVSTVDPGDTRDFPTTEFSYENFVLPTTVIHKQRTISGTSQTIETKERFDGAGRMIERRMIDEIGEIIVSLEEYNSRGLVSRIYLERRAFDSHYSQPDATLPHTSFTYDALGRIIQRTNIDGSIYSLRYGPNWIEEADEESNRFDENALHSGVITRRMLDANRRVIAIENQLKTHTVRTFYEYDVKGNLLKHIDAVGNEVNFTYDLLGRTIRAVRPEQSSITVLDAAGNNVETISNDRHVKRKYDLANRLVEESTNGSEGIVRYTWHDAKDPLTSDSDSHSIGHLERIEDDAGITRFKYDLRGRVIRKLWQSSSHSNVHELDFEYRSDNQISFIIYPYDGIRRTKIIHRYNARGLLDGIPSIVDKFEYDLAGRRIAAHYSNEVTETSTYDSRGRRTSSLITNPEGILRSTTYELDLVGNLTDIVSPDPKLSCSYVYDDNYRLIGATRSTGESWSYSYDDAGRLTHKSDIGDYLYGKSGVPSTCVSSAGTETFTYTSNGEMQNTPWGIQKFDTYGRLSNIFSYDKKGRIDLTYDFSGRRVSIRSQGTVTPKIDLQTPDDLYSIESEKIVLHIGGCALLSSNKPINFVHRDHLGGVVLVSDDKGHAIDRRYYDPYGKLLEHIGFAEEVHGGFGGGITDEWTGLIYLKSRYYHPNLGLFISPDPIVGNMFDPLAWASYAYCRGNPVSYVDPSGRSFWRTFILVVAIVALVALTIVTLGSSSPLLIAAVGIGVLGGGVVGGISAARAKGDTGDILTGIVVGMAVGGWGAFLGGGISGAIMGKLGTGIVGSAVAGGLSGAVNGAAMGFAAGFGSKSDAATIMTLMWQSLLVGLVTGAALGALTGAVTSGEIKKPDLNSEYDKKINEISRSESGTKAPDPNMSGTNPDSPSQSGSLSRPNPTSPTAAIGKGASWAGGPLIKAAEYYGGVAGAMAPVQVAISDMAAGTWGIFHDDITTYLRRNDIKIEF